MGRRKQTLENIEVNQHEEVKKSIRMSDFPEFKVTYFDEYGNVTATGIKSEGHLFNVQKGSAVIEIPKPFFMDKVVDKEISPKVSEDSIKVTCANDTKTEYIKMSGSRTVIKQEVPLGNLLITKKEPEHYDNSKGSIYKFANDQKLNSYEFDIIKRIIRCRKKGLFKEDLEKTKFLIDLYLKEFEDENRKEVP